jgi:integrase
MESTALALTGRDALIAIGKLANEYADGNTFEDFNKRKSANTLTAYRGDLASFAAYVSEATGGAARLDAGELQTTPDAWTGVTWGLVSGFNAWLLKNGASIGTINRKLAAVKVYAALAADAGALDGREAAHIASRIKGYSGKAAGNVDEERTKAGTPTRQGAKKAAHVKLERDQVAALKTQPDTPQGRRDALLMCLLLDHGLRVGEVAILVIDGVVMAGKKPEKVGFNLTEGTFRFYRPKVDKVQTHRMTADTLRALAAYLESDASIPGALLFRRSRKGGKLTDAGVTERNLSGRVRTLGQRIGIENLSAHDCRHSWATRAVAGGTDAFALRDAGGWSSLAMPSRYVEAARIANEKVTLKR